MAERAEQDGEELERPGEAARDALGVADRVQLRDQLAERDVENGQDRVAEHHRDRDRGGMPEHVAERLLEHLREGGLADGADADRGERDADLADRDVLVDAVDLAAGEARALHALLLERLDAVAARADERVLGRHEEGVHQDERRDGEEEDRDHSAVVPCELLRGGSSSLMRGGREASRGSGAHTSELICRASSKSFSVSPPSECVESVQSTVFHEIARSGWWFISSAAGVMRFTKSTEPWKSSNLNCRLMASPSRSQPGRSDSR